MDKKTFATRVLGLKKRQHFDAVLLGKRNLSYKRSRLAAHVLGTAANVWQDSDLVLARRAAWEKFIKDAA